MPARKSSTDRSNRFWSKIKITPYCWEWGGALTHSGYGRFALTGRKTVRAHRFAFEDFYGEISKDACVLHHCDNPKCVRPDHLFWGSHKDNAMDREHKGRGADKHGEKSAVSKLTASGVKEIREKYLPRKYTQYRLAKEYGVCQAQIWRILNGKNW